MGERFMRTDAGACLGPDGHMQGCRPTPEYLGHIDNWERQQGRQDSQLQALRAQTADAERKAKAETERADRAAARIKDLRTRLAAHEDRFQAALAKAREDHAQVKPEHDYDERRRIRELREQERERELARQRKHIAEQAARADAAPEVDPYEARRNACQTTRPEFYRPRQPAPAQRADTVDEALAHRRGAWARRHEHLVRQPEERSTETRDDAEDTDPLAHRRNAYEAFRKRD